MTKKKAKPLRLRLGDVNVTVIDPFSETSLVQFEYLPPKHFHFDGVEMYPGVIKIRMKGPTGEADRDG